MERELEWNDVCSFGCYYAKEIKCSCKCDGAHHGEGSGLQRLENFMGGVDLGE